MAHFSMLHATNINQKDRGIDSYYGALRLDAIVRCLDPISTTFGAALIAFWSATALRKFATLAEDRNAGAQENAGDKKQ
jgi:hypothetical protein